MFTPPLEQPDSGTNQCMQTLPMILLMVGVFYFLLIRPQQKKEKDRRTLVDALKKGDKVVMNSGLHGVVEQLADKTVTLRVDGDVKLTFDRTAIQRAAEVDATTTPASMAYSPRFLVMFRRPSQWS